MIVLEALDNDVVTQILNYYSYKTGQMYLSREPCLARNHGHRLFTIS